MAGTLPAETANDNTPAVVIEATYKDPRTGALYVHEDLVKTQEPWAEEAHIPPPRAEEAFGDVESWAAYVKRFAADPDFPPFLSWNSAGFRAVLDYHDHVEQAGRCQWTAAYPFVHSVEWKRWMALATGQAVPHKQVVERIEDYGDDITDPPQADLMTILRNLRSAVNATAQTELLPDGTTRVGFTQDKSVKSLSGVDLPSEFSITIPVLKGDTTLYKMAVRVRASVDDSAHLTLRLSIPNAERTLEAVYLARVEAAKALLGSLSVLRAAG